MRHIDIKDKIPELLPQLPDWAEFVRLGNLTKLRDNPNGTFHHANYESGLLLYALVRHFRPNRILEIGTGRGYGSFCMAMALRDGGIDGKIITLDVQGYEEKIAWALDDGSGARIENLSRRDVWEKYLDADLRRMVELRQGYSSEGMARLLEENNFHPQLIYIDGDHSYTVTRHDLFASMLLADRPFRILLDDYHPRSDLYGVRRLVDDMLEPVFQMDAIYDDRRWYGEVFEQWALGQARYAQVLLDSEKTHQAVEAAFPRQRLERVVKAHRRWGRWSLFWENRLLNLRKRLGLLGRVG
jgi:hypothetical protein